MEEGEEGTETREFTPFELELGQFMYQTDLVDECFQYHYKTKNHVMTDNEARTVAKCVGQLNAGTNFFLKVFYGTNRAFNPFVPPEDPPQNEIEEE